MTSQLYNYVQQLSRTCIIHIDKKEYFGHYKNHGFLIHHLL
jgi:hypothetical protein